MLCAEGKILFDAENSSCLVRNIYEGFKPEVHFFTVRHFETTNIKAKAQPLQREESPTAKVGIVERPHALPTARVQSGARDKYIPPSIGLDKIAG